MMGRKHEWPLAAAAAAFFLLTVLAGVSEAQLNDGPGPGLEDKQSVSLINKVTLTTKHMY